MRLIDADELCERILKTMDKNITDGKLFDNYGLSLAQGFIIGSPTIDLVRCKDCKHYDTESRTFPCCTDIFGAVRYMEADGFCSKGERRADEHTDKRD